MKINRIVIKIKIIITINKMCTFIMAQGVFQLYQVGIIIIIYFTDMETEAGID